MWKFESIKDLLGFTKLALYMSEEAAAKKISKWIKNKEVIPLEDDEYLLQPKVRQLNDVLFINRLDTKYVNWLHSDKQKTLII